MKLKTVTTEDHGEVALLEGGNPVIVHDDGKEAPLEYADLIQRVKRISDERDKALDRAKTAEGRANRFDVSDEEIEEALKVKRSLSEKKLMDAGKVDEAVKERLDAAQKQWEKEKSELESALQEREAHLDKLLISNKFSSTGVLEDYFLTPDLAEAAFGRHFKREGDQITPYKRLPNGNGDSGERIFSRSKPGELADFDEALKELLESHPNRDKWKRGSGASGSGAPGSNGGSGDARSKTRDEFERMEPSARMEFIKGGGQVQDAA